MIKLMSVLMLLGSEAVFAASGADGEAGLKDLFYPVLNFSLFAALVIWKSTPVVRKAFESNSKKVSELFSLAEKKDKEAEAKLAEYKSKINEVEAEYNKIMAEAVQEGDAYAKNQKDETRSKVERYRKDAHVKVVSEKEAAIREVNESLLNEVILKTKKQIQGNLELRGNATSRLMSSI